jgi:hypothetical protein
MNMLKILELPFSATLHLDCISKTTHNDSEALLLRIVSAHFQIPAPVELRSLTIDLMTSSLNVTASTFPSTLQNSQTQNSEGGIVGNTELVLSFDRLSNPGRSTDLLKQACKMLPISNLEIISMSATHIVDINWAELFSSCTNVTTIQANGNGTSSLVRALTAPTVTNDDRASTLVQPASTVAHAHAAIFPKLKFLELFRLNFSEG